MVIISGYESPFTYTNAVKISNRIMMMIDYKMGQRIGHGTMVYTNVYVIFKFKRLSVAVWLCSPFTSP